MRFNERIELFNVIILGDGLGGRREVINSLGTYKANVRALSVEETFKIYGKATTDTYKLVLHGIYKEKAVKIKYDNNFYKILNKRYIKNKTSYLVELVEND